MASKALMKTKQDALTKVKRDTMFKALMKGKILGAYSIAQSE
jgi:hypothetical protein